MVMFREIAQPPVYEAELTEDQVVIKMDRGFILAPWSVRVNGKLHSGATSAEEAMGIARTVILEEGLK